MDYDVIDARYVNGYIVWLRFRDGTAGEIDLGPELYGDALNAFGGMQPAAHLSR